MSAGFRSKLAVARTAGRLSRGTGRGGGTTLPGRLLLRLAPDAIERLGAELEVGSTLISATNGKTTTAAMLAAAMSAAGREPVHNRAGSNMAWGVATALLEQGGAEGLFEIDEAWLPRVAPQLHPRLIVLGNLFRDQLDRYGELETLADDWVALAENLTGSCEFALNADDPLIADLGRDQDQGHRRPGVSYFGIDDASQALPQLQHAHDAKHCRRCGHPYVYERAFVGHLGHYHCPNCGAHRPQPDVAATKIDLEGMAGSTVHITAPEGPLELRLPLPGLYNVYNALAALAAAMALGVPAADAKRGIEGMQAVFGRVETIDVAGRDLSILLIKNPVGANEVLRTLRLEAERDQPIDAWIALNDNIADGRDVSWIWDADFELLDGALRRVVCAGTRAPEMALRLKYGGVPTEIIEVEIDISSSLDRVLSGAEEGARVFALPTYTALLELRNLLADRGFAREYWERER